MSSVNKVDDDHVLLFRDDEKLLPSGVDSSSKEHYDSNDEKAEPQEDLSQYPFCHPKRHYRWFLLVFICFLTFGSYFCYDNPGALKDVIESDLNVNSFQYNLLYSLYSWPNTVLCFFGGILIDRVFGLRWGAIIFGGFILLGQLLFALGAQLSSFVLMEIGRFVFGLGGENLAVAQNAYTVKWFSGGSLNLVFGLQLSMSRVGSTVNFNIELPIAQQYGLAFALWVGAILCLNSSVISIVLGILDKRATAKLGEEKQVAAAEKLSLRDVAYFPLSAWLIFLICVFYYMAIFPFIGNATTFLADKWATLGVTKQIAATMTSLPYLISAGASPVFGFFVDRTGLNPVWTLLATLLTLASHMLLTFTLVTPWAAMAMLGISYSLCACALWPMIGYLVLPQRIGTAYGLMQAIQNLGLAVAPLIVGKLHLLDPTAYPEMYFFVASSGVAVVLAVLLIVWDKCKDGILVNSRAVIKARLEKMLSDAAKKQAEEVEQQQQYVADEETARIVYQRPSVNEIRMSYLHRLGFYEHVQYGNPQA